MRPRPLDLALVLLLLIATAAFVWPLYPAFIDGPEPFVLGLPAAFAWHVAWVVGVFLLLCAYHTLARHGEERE